MKNILAVNHSLLQQSKLLIGKSRQKLANLYRDFKTARSGNMSIMFGASLIPLVAATGMSIDYSSAVRTKSTMQAALDGAALAAGRTLQTTGSTSQASTTAVNYFNTLMTNANMSGNVHVDSIDGTTGTIQLSATSSVNTSFMSVMGFNTLDVTAASEAKLAVGGNGDKNIEISMMLDVTGSMEGNKLSTLKTASKDLIQIVLQGNTQTLTTTRVALVPFSESVNLDTYAAAVRGSVPTRKTIGSGRSAVTYNLAGNCVTERLGTNKYTDVTPGVGNYVGAQYNSSGRCTPSTKLIPLTDNKTTLDNAINSYSASGGTAGHLGTAWAWYTLSPNWANIWPATSAPGSYNDSKLQKIAILMTDGEYNTQYDSNGVNGTSPNGNSTTQARALCTAMKNAGITVYTVGFQLSGSTSRTTMQQCATSNDHFFLAENSNELLQAFREIAFQIAKLRLTK